MHGSPQAMPSTSTWPNCSRTDGRTTTSEAARNAGSSSWPCQPARKTSRAPVRRTASIGCSPSHSPGKPPTSTSGARRANAGLRERVRLDQQRHALDLGEATDVEEHGRVAVGVGERREVGLLVARPSRRRRRARQPARLVDQVAAPVRAVVDVTRMERLRVEAVGDAGAAVRIEPEQRLGAGDLGLRQHDHALAGGGPVAHPPRPRLGVRPAARVGVDRLEHQQLPVPCRWPTIRTPGATRAAASLIGVR